jgi:hypothetical protein
LLLLLLLLLRMRLEIERSKGQVKMFPQCGNGWRFPDRIRSPNEFHTFETPDLQYSTKMASGNRAAGVEARLTIQDHNVLPRAIAVEMERKNEISIACEPAHIHVVSTGISWP